MLWNGRTLEIGDCSGRGLDNSVSPGWPVHAQQLRRVNTLGESKICAREKAYWRCWTTCFFAPPPMSAIELQQIFAKVRFKHSGYKTRYVGTARSATVQPIALYSSPCRFQRLFPENRRGVTLINMWHAWLDFRWSWASVLAPSQEHQSYPRVPGDGTEEKKNLHLTNCPRNFTYSVCAVRHVLQFWGDRLTPKSLSPGYVSGVSHSSSRWNCSSYDSCH